MTTTLDGYPGLLEAIDDLRGGDPLHPVTVLAPSPAASRDIRRALARAGGSAAVEVVPVTAHLSEQRLAGLHPLRPAGRDAIDAAVLAVLAEAPGALAYAAEQEGTVDAVSRALRGVRHLDDAELEAIVAAEPGALHAEILALALRARRRLRAEGLVEGPELDEAVLRRMRDAGDVILLGGFPDTRVAELLHDRLGELANVRVLPVAPEPAEPALDHVGLLHASDAEEEVNAVVRRVVDLLAEGVPGHEIAVAHPGGIYPNLLFPAFARAGIAVNGTATHGVADSAAARGLLLLLDEDPARIRREAVLDALSSGALATVERHGTRVPAFHAERLTRDTLPVTEGGGWGVLDVTAADVAATRATVMGVPEVTDRDEATAARARALLAWVRDLSAALAAVHEAMGSWVDLAEALVDLIEGFLPKSADRSVLAACAAALGSGVPGAPPAGTTPRTLLARRLPVTAPVGQPGAGVRVELYRDACGRRVRHLFALGCAEGILPPLHRDDPTLPDAVTGDSPAGRQRRLRRVFHAALAAAERVTCSLPRGDLRSTMVYRPSRWLDARVDRILADAGLAGRDPMEISGIPGLDSARSFVAALIEEAPATRQQLWLGVLAQVSPRLIADPERPGAATYRSLLPKPIADRLATAARIQRDRLRGVPSSFNCATYRDPGVLAKGLSASRLEEYIAQPFLYFIGKVLGAEVLDHPVDAEEIDALGKGSLVHAILEDWTNRRIDDQVGAPDADAWADALEAIAEEHLDAHDSAGYLPNLWRRTREQIISAARAFGRLDAHESAFGWRPIAAELTFGGTEGPEVLLDVGAAPPFRFRGSIDRVDVNDITGQYRVTDYKTGKGSGYADVASDTPTAYGTRLQLGIYGLAMRTIHGPAETLGRYLFVELLDPKAAAPGLPGEEQSREVPADAAIAQLTADLTELHRSLRTGWFPPPTEIPRYLADDPAVIRLGGGRLAVEGRRIADHLRGLEVEDTGRE